MAIPVSYTHLEGVYLGLGQRLLASDQGEYPLLDVRLLRLGESAGSLAPESV